MTRTLAIQIFVDACGWDVIAERPWFLPELGHRQEVESVLGYSSACVPAILSGLRPDENDHFCFLRWSPEESPFKRQAGWAKLLPGAIARRSRVRKLLSAQLAAELDLTGYFSLYDLPLDRLGEFDWTEKKDLFVPGGLNRGQSIFDCLAAAGVNYHVSDWRIAEEKRFAKAQHEVSSRELAFAFVYAADLDGILHQYGHDRSRVDRYLRVLQARVRSLVAAARSRYDRVEVALFSDHGMAEVAHIRNIRGEIDALGLRWGHDYGAVFDSTMARFWFLSDRAERRIRGALQDDARGRWVSEEREKTLGVHWPNRRYGDAFYLLEPGQLLCPSHLGHKPIRGMHGYRTDHVDSYATLLTDVPPRGPVHDLTDLFSMMKRRARLEAGRVAA